MRRSMAVLAGVAGVVTIAAGGLAFALNAATGDNGARNACHPDQVGCTNQYQVALGCGNQQEPKSVSVLAPSPDLAEAKAERYHRGCRSRGASFVASVISNAAVNYYGGSRPGDARTADDGPPKWRRAWRFRRR